MIRGLLWCSRGFSVLRHILWTSIGWVVRGESLYSPFSIVYFPMQKHKVIIIWLRKIFLYYSLHKILFKLYSTFPLVAFNACVWMAYDDTAGLAWQKYWQNSKLTVMVLLLWQLFSQTSDVTVVTKWHNCSDSVIPYDSASSSLWF